MVRPVLLAGLANALLFAAVDRSQPLSWASALLGLALVAVVMTRQMAQILSLQRQTRVRARQLAVVSEVVSALSRAPEVGTTLGMALEKLVTALEADGGAIWLPMPHEGNRMVLAEQRGLPDPQREADLLAAIWERARPDEGVARMDLEVTRGENGAAAARVMTTPIRDDDRIRGLLMVLRWHGEFQETDDAVMTAVGSDIGGAMRGDRIVNEARRLSEIDPITGLLNHGAAYQRLDEELERHHRAWRPMAAIMMDLDGFKLFNDVHGHAAGDDVLRRIGRALERSCREGDIIARYGGDEFMVILPDTTMKQAIRCAERIQTALAKERFLMGDSADIPVTFSYGVAAYPEDGRDARALLGAGETNLTQSRGQGGNRITARGLTTIEDTLSQVSGFDLFAAMVTAIDNKDGYTRKHSEEVTAYSLDIARAVGLCGELLETLRISGMLHDVGKIGVPDSILRKPGRLTGDEFAIMQQHPVFGALIVGALPGMEQVVHGVRHHHERYDGRGYPDGLAREAIPLLGRIMAVADCFSAMTTNRPYRRGLSEEEALDEIRRCKGTQFDPEIADVFLRLREVALPAPLTAAEGRELALV